MCLSQPRWVLRRLATCSSSTEAEEKTTSVCYTHSFTSVCPADGRRLCHAARIMQCRSVASRGRQGTLQFTRRTSSYVVVLESNKKAAHGPDVYTHKHTFLPTNLFSDTQQNKFKSFARKQLNFTTKYHYSDVSSQWKMWNNQISHISTVPFFALLLLPNVN